MRRQLKALFVIRDSEHYYYFKSIVKALVRRGYKIRVLFDRDCSLKNLNQIEKSKLVDYYWAIKDSTKFRKLLFHFHDLLSYRRYLVGGNQSSFYKERWRKYYLFAPFRFLLKLPFFEWLLASDVAEWVFKLVINAAPADPKILGQIKSPSPNVAVITPGDLPFLSAEKEYLMAARQLGIPVVLPVFSWDNLTTKGVIFPHPDLLLVWNKTQFQEAVHHHKIAKKSIRIVGAPLFDFWFDIKKPSMSKRDFCRKFGLDLQKPILLYIGSSDSLVGDERWLVEKIRDELDKSEKLREIQIILRPHPFKNSFEGFSLSRVKVIPEGNAWPDNIKASNLYFNSLYYSFAVVGVNTSGFIDAAILDRPIIGLLTEKYRRTQTETEHFRQLVKNNVCDLVSLQNISQSISAILGGKDKHKKDREKFVENFIRPLGINFNAGEVAAREIERVVAGKKI